MTFFDRKEEVLEVELTPYGRYLLSWGELTPVYYSFFDDEIIYDSDCIGYSENQNDTEGRIKDALRPHCQATYRSLPDRMGELGLYNFGNRRLQYFFEREYSLSSELGVAAYYSNHSPSWDVRLLKGEINNSSLVHTASGPTYNIPQIDVEDVLYEKKIKRAGDLRDLRDRSLKEVLGPFGSDREIYIELERDFLLLEFNENNSIFQKDNFEIELFRVDSAGPGEDIRSDPYIDENNEVIEFERLVPLRFDQYRGKQETQYAEYVFDLDVDKEIDEEVLCRYKGIDSTKGLFLQRAFDCGPPLDEAPAGQYDTDLEDIGKVCT